MGLDKDAKYKNKIFKLNSIKTIEVIRLEYKIFTNTENVFFLPVLIKNYYINIFRTEEDKIWKCVIQNDIFHDIKENNTFDSVEIINFCTEHLLKNNNINKYKIIVHKSIIYDTNN